MRNSIERRREERTLREGDVALTLTGDGDIKVWARLLDTSRGGFRAAHSHPELSAGREVEFTREDVSGRARVIWTRILGEEAESGFLILE
ncbi:MAG: hypothetical protein IT160_03120 [Bryobacterales bacterium]|nr:hypothetical protein [Bryobacterales bacterium]